MRPDAFFFSLIRSAHFSPFNGPRPGTLQLASTHCTDANYTVVITNSLDTAKSAQPYWQFRPVRDPNPLTFDLRQRRFVKTFFVLVIIAL